MFLRQDWAYLLAGLALLVWSAYLSILANGAFSIFAAFGFVICALPMIQRLEIHNRPTEGFSLKFERPRVDETIRHFEAVSQSKSSTAELRTQLAEATAELQSLKSNSDASWVGPVAGAVALGIFVLVCVSDSEPPTPKKTTPSVITTPAAREPKSASDVTPEAVAPATDLPHAVAPPISADGGK